MNIKVTTFTVSEKSSNITITYFVDKSRAEPTTLSMEDCRLLGHFMSTVLPAKSDSDVVFCLQLLSKTLTCTLHLR